jgi:NAD(P)-dependent dehydrogenase (short-subunit alcohol dehydrogenase family)
MSGPGPFAGRVAVVTGGAGAIGRAIGARLARDGARVVVADVAIDQAREAAQDLENSIGLGVDVTDLASTRELVARVVERFGRLDFLINNAGINRPGTHIDQTEDDWRAVLDVNLTGPFNMLQAAIPTMQTQRYGRIVNIASRVWLGGVRPGYTASKTGLVGLTRSAAKELGPHNITCNALAPSRVETPAVLSFWSEEEWADIMREEMKLTPLRRLATPEDVAAGAAFFCSADAAFITGEVLHICGGSQLL